MSDDLSIVRKVVFKGRMFYAEGTCGVADSLKACRSAGMEPLYMPELAMARVDADNDSILWKRRFLAPSVRITGRSKAGNPVAVYAHVPTSLSDPDSAKIKKIIDDSTFNGVGPIPEDEFYALLDQEGNGRVFVVDYAKLRKSRPSFVVEVDDVLDHPQMVPFLGGEQIAQKYLAKYKDVYNKSQYKLGVLHIDDLEDRPMGCVLSADVACLGLVCGRYSVGYVVGVSAGAQEQGLEERVKEK